MVSIDLERFAMLVDEIYSTTTAPERWGEVMAKIAEAFSSEGAVLFVQDLETPGSFLVASDGAAAQAGDSLRARYAGGPDSPVGLHRVADGTFEADYCVGRYAATGDSFGVLLAIRREAAACDPPATRELSLLLPHVARSVGLQRQLAFARGAFADALQSLDRASIGMLLLDRSSRVLEMNERARVACREPSPLRIRDGRLGSPTWQEAQLRDAVAAMADLSAGRRGRGRGGEVFRIGRIDAGQPLLVAVLPGRDGMTGSTGSALVLTMSAEPVPARCGEQLRVLFGLSPAECRVALLLCEGKSVDDIARDTKRARGTVRTHVKRILGKTRTTRQTELVALLLRLGARADLTGAGPPE